MILSSVCAIANGRVIGSGNGIPWVLPSDLKHFRELTMGKPVIMGRRTFESIGKPLPGRTNIVLSRSIMPEERDGIEVCATLAEAIVLAERTGAEETFVIGGAQVYREAMPFLRRQYLSLLDCRCEGDAFYPPFRAEDWHATHWERHREDIIPWVSVILERRF